MLFKSSDRPPSSICISQDPFRTLIYRWLWKQALICKRAPRIWIVSEKDNAKPGRSCLKSQNLSHFHKCSAFVLFVKLRVEGFSSIPCVVSGACYSIGCTPFVRTSSDLPLQLRSDLSFGLKPSNRESYSPLSLRNWLTPPLKAIENLQTKT